LVRRGLYMDVRQEITDQIISALEGGVPPWRKGWAANVAPFNASSGKPYRGVNQLITLMQGRQDPRWVTFKQAQAMGLSVRKGEKGTRIIKLVEVERGEDGLPPDDGEVVASDQRRRLVMKAYSVFTAEQVEGFAPLPVRDCTIEPADAVMAIAEGLKQKEGGSLSIRFVGSQPAYSPRTDEVRIPPLAQHISADEFHGSLLHECVHATGHPKRLARLHMDAKFGSAEYAREELVAEIGTCMALLAVNLPPSKSSLENHAAYIESWLKLLRGDKAEIFRAAALAQKAADYLCEQAVRHEPREAREKVACAVSEDEDHPATCFARTRRQNS
jgi:antirestriction protein ArdC